MRSPRLPTNSAVFPTSASLVRSSSQRLMASTAWRPTGHDASLAAFAEHANRTVRQVDVGQIESNQLRQTQARGIKQFHHRLVAHADLFVGAEAEQAGHLIDVDGRGQTFLRLRGLHLDRRD